jgi:uncharacterized damage-inducible protein DinB
MSISKLIDDYAAGPSLLRQAVRGMSREQLLARPIEGKWSTHECVCHIADFEPVYVDRMTRVIAQEKPTYFGGDPDLYAAKLSYSARDVEEELNLIDACRKHLVRILRSLPEAAFQRKGNHNEAGEQTLEKLLTNVTKHIPHHIEFIRQKRQALGMAG